MRHGFSTIVSMAGIAAACAACGGGSSPASTGGAGGSVATTSTTTSATSTTTTSATGGSGGTGTTVTCSLPGDNVYDNSADISFTACEKPIAPAPSEDGSYVVAVFGPFPKGFMLEGISFLSYEKGNGGVTDPWTISATVVPAGGDPLKIDPSAGAKPYPLTEVDSAPAGIPAGSSTSHRFAIQLDASVPVAACESVVIGLRNTVGPPLSAVLMCGDPGSPHPETNQWWNLDGTMDQMSKYQPDFDRDWAVSLVPAAP
jgi:hypothetical protein